MSSSTTYVLFARGYAAPMDYCTDDRSRAYGLARSMSRRMSVAVKVVAYDLPEYKEAPLFLSAAETMACCPTLMGEAMCGEEVIEGWSLCIDHAYESSISDWMGGDGDY